MLSKLTVANAAGSEDVVLHEDTSTSKRSLVDAKGLVGVGPLRDSKRVRPQAHGSINETTFEEGRSIQLTGEVMSPGSIENALAEFRKVSGVLRETLDNGPALMKWTEGATGNKLQQLVKLDSECEPTLHDAAAFLDYAVTLFAEDPRAYTQTQTTTTGAGLTGSGIENEFAGTSSSLIVGGLVINGSNIFWANGAYIGRMTLAGGTVEPEWKRPGGVGGAGPGGQVTALAIDAGHIYAALSSGYIARLTVAGATLESEWLNIGGTALGLAVDASFIYWTALAGPATSFIGRATIAGAEANGVWTELANFTVTGGLTVDAAHIYFGGSTSVGRCAIGGTAKEPNWIVGTGEVRGVAVSSEFVYWLQGGAGFIGRAKLAGTEVNTVFLPGVSSSNGLAANASHLYYGGIQRTGKTDMAIGRSVSLAAGPVGSEVTVTQAGNVPAPVTFKVYGPIVNPVIFAVASGEGLALAGSIGAGEYVEINVADRTVEGNGTTSRLDMLLPALSNWLALEAPPNASPKYKMGAASATAAKLEAIYRSAYA